jgi:hypothetical protein
MSTHREDSLAASVDAARVAAELRALGEPELGEHELDATPNAAVVAAFALAHEPVVGEELDELARERAWRKIAARVVPKQPARTSAPRTFRATWVAVATAAGIALVPMLGPQLRAQRGVDHATAAAVGEQAHAALELVPGTQDQARAREYAARYAERLHGDGEDR